MSVLSIAEPDRAPRSSDFSGLVEIVRGSGLLKRRHLYYVLRFGIVLGLFAASWAMVVILGNTWWQLLVAAFMGLVFTQLAFLGHDVGHRQVFRTRRAAETAGLLIGNLGIGLGFGWWLGKHNKHHENPNHVDEDPDIATGTIVWTEEQAEQRRNPVTRWLGARQRYWFFPILLLEGLQLKVESFRSLPGPAVKRKVLESSLLVAHVAIYLTVLLAILPLGLAVVFVAVHLGVFGVYMGCSFAPNHKGMELLDEKQDFLRKQVLTARNVRGGRVLEHLLGGLNHQIEHHLFPSMPMPNLARAKPIIRAYCARLDIAYHETGVVESYRQILSYLHEVAAPMRAAQPEPGSS